MVDGCAAIDGLPIGILADSTSFSKIPRDELGYFHITVDCEVMVTGSVCIRIYPYLQDLIEQTECKWNSLIWMRKSFAENLFNMRLNQV